MLELEKKVKLNNYGVILKGVESTDYATFHAAEFLLDEANLFRSLLTGEARLFTFPGLEKADKLLDTFTLQEVFAIMNSSKWSESLVRLVYDLTTTTKLPKAQVMELIQKAGAGGKGDPGRLTEIIRSMNAATYTYDDIVKAIIKSDEFAASVELAMNDVEHGFEKLSREIWGDDVVITASGDVEVAEKFKKGTLKSGFAAYDQVIRLGNRGDGFASGIVSGGKIDYAKWEVMKSVINKTNIPDGLKGNIIGELWTRVNIVKFKAKKYVEGETLFREVKFTNGSTNAKADIVLVNQGEMRIIECKSMEGQLSPEQKIIYPYLERGEYKKLMILNNPGLDAIYKGGKHSISYTLVRDVAPVAP